MGSPTTEEGRQQFAETQHPVTVGNFWLAETEVTQAQWKAVMGGYPSDFKSDARPVEKVNWYDVKEFIKKLNNLTGKQFRLPTEAEWEYAVRDGLVSFLPLNIVQQNFVIQSCQTTFLVGKIHFHLYQCIYLS